MDDEILELNKEIHDLVDDIGIKENAMPDARDLKDKDDEYSVWSNLTDLRDKLIEIEDLIDVLSRNYEYD